MLKEVLTQSSGLVGLDSAPIMLEFCKFFRGIVGFHEALYTLFYSSSAFMMNWYDFRNVLI